MVDITTTQKKLIHKNDITEISFVHQNAINARTYWRAIVLNQFLFIYMNGEIKMNVFCTYLQFVYVVDVTQAYNSADFILCLLYKVYQQCFNVFLSCEKKKQKASIFKTDFCMHFTKSTVFAIFKFFLGAIFLLFLFLSDSSYDCIYSISLQWQITFTLVFCFSNVEIEEIEKNQTNIYYYFLLAFSIFIDSKHKLEAISTISIWNAHFSIHLW